VQGRHDVVCPPSAAATLHSLWPGSTLRIVESGAHALFERPVRTAVQAALAQLLPAAANETGVVGGGRAAGAGGEAGGKRQRSSGGM